MVMHIELSYCTFQAFKLLAKNYLGIEDHALFGDIKELMQKHEARLGNLIQALKDFKPKAQQNAKGDAAEMEGMGSHQDDKKEDWSAKETNQLL